MVEDLERLAQVMTEEQGKPIQASRNEVKYAADFLLWFAEIGDILYPLMSTINIYNKYGQL